MTTSQTSEIARLLITAKVWDTLSFQDRTQVDAGVDRPLIQAHLEKAWRSERLSYAMLIGSLVITAIFIVTWGLQFGSTSNWAYALAAVWLAWPFGAAYSYAEAKRIRATWEVVDTLFTSSASALGASPIAEEDLVFQHHAG